MVRILSLLLTLLALLATTPHGFAAPSPDADYYRGNTLYEEGKFSEAIQAYQASAASGATSADLYYNLGNAYAREGNTGMALLNYERALVLRPSYPEAQSNANFLRSDIAEIPPTPSATDRWFSGVSPHSLTLIATGAIWTMIVSLLLILLQRFSPMRGLALAFSGLVASYALIGILLHNALSSHSALALVTAPDTKAFYSPSNSAEAVSPVPVGTKVLLLSESGAWAYCQLPDQRRGWIDTTTAEQIIPSPPMKIADEKADSGNDN